MVSSIEVDSKVLIDDNLVKVLLWEKGKMANVMLEIYRRVFFGMSSYIPAFKVCVFASDFEVWIGVNKQVEPETWAMRRQGFSKMGWRWISQS